jgi:hypothetical protein
MDAERALEGDSAKALSMLGGTTVTLQVCTAPSLPVCSVAGTHASRQSLNLLRHEDLF